MADQKISELTAATSAASADLFNIVQGGSNKKLTVANFLANLNSPVVINGNGADQDTRIAGDNDANLVYTDAGNDKVGIGTDTPDEKLDVNGNLAITGGFLRLATTPQSLSGSGSLVVNTSAAVTYITTVGGSATLSFADGVQGQEKTLVMIGDAGDAVLSPSSPSGFTTITFNDVGDTARLIFLNSKWNILSVYGATVA
jgi:hypothetical protein